MRILGLLARNQSTELMLKRVPHMKSRPRRLRNHHHRRHSLKRWLTVNKRMASSMWTVDTTKVSIGKSPRLLWKHCWRQMRGPGKRQQPSFRALKLSARSNSSKGRVQSRALSAMAAKKESQAGDAHPLDGDKVPVRRPWKDKKKNLQDRPCWRSRRVWFTQSGGSRRMRLLSRGEETLVNLEK